MLTIRSAGCRAAVFCCFLLAVMLAAPLAASAQTTALFLDSQTGDYVGGGQTRTWTATDGKFAAARNYSGGVNLSAIGPSHSFWWYLSFAAAGDAPLAPGTYESAKRYPFTAFNGLDVSGDGRGCNRQTGRFVVLEAEYAPNGDVLRFAADFEQHCENMNPALFGSIRFNSTISDLTPFGGNYPAYGLDITPSVGGTVTATSIDCGGGAIACSLDLTAPGDVSITATPDPGYFFTAWSGDCFGESSTVIRVNGPKRCAALFEPLVVPSRTLLVFDSETGDQIGQGRRLVQSSVNSVFTARRTTASGTGFEVVAVSPGEARDVESSIRVSAAAGQPFAMGVEQQAIASLGPAAAPSFFVRMDGGGCATGTGRFIVYELAYNGDGTIARLAVDLEQHCNDAAPGLFVSVRINSTVAETAAFGGEYPRYTLAVVPSPNGTVSAEGIACGAGAVSCGATFAAATLVTLTAAPSPGFIFAGWSGSCRGMAAASVHVNAPKTCAAAFEPHSPTSPRTLLFVDRLSSGAGTTNDMLSPLNSTWTTSTGFAGNSVSFDIEYFGSDGARDYFSLDLSVPQGQVLQAGTTYAAVRYPFPTAIPGISTSEGCNENTGRFVVREIEIAPDGSLARFAADFEEHCNDRDAAIAGAIRYNSTIAGIAPFGGEFPRFSVLITPPQHGSITGVGLACGTAGTSCAASFPAAAPVTLTATPDPGYILMGWTGPCHGGAVISFRLNTVRTCSAVFEPAVATAARTRIAWASGEDHYVGQGRSEVYSSVNSVWTAWNSTKREIRFTVEGWGDRAESELNFVFAVPAGQELQVGRQYAIAEDAPYDAERMQIYGNGRYCDGEGFFNVRELVWHPDGKVARAAVDFEQHCGSTPESYLTGSLHYNATTSMAPSSVSLDRLALTFVAGHTGSGLSYQTAAQAVRLLQTPGRNVTWTATPSQPWIVVSPASGSGPATLSVSVEYASTLPVAGTLDAQIHFTFEGAANAAGPVGVTLSLSPAGTSTAPMGLVETPLQGTNGVTGSIGVTGWAIDDVEVTAVRILRDPVPGEGSAQIFVGNAVFVDGSRPDVAASYPHVPRSTRAGWGYLLLTNFLPNRGNGTFVLHAYADDAEGHTTLLGSRTITCTNILATHPFGAIDTPAQGEVIGGTSYNNFGWVLSRGQRRADPPGGGSVSVVIDGVIVGAPGGWTNRWDISTLFPLSEYSGVNSALAVFTLDPSMLTDGVHTIAWVVTDDQNNASGVGSRYFTVANGSVASAPVGSAVHARVNASTAAASRAPVAQASISGRRGYQMSAPFRPLTSADGRATLEGEELDRFEVQVGGEGAISGYVETAGLIGPLPIGSHLDTNTGVFTWQPGVGFVGSYDLVFVRSSDGRAVTRNRLRITLHPKGTNRVGPQITIDTPSPGDVESSFLVAGWAIDTEDRVGTGVDAVHVWAYPIDGVDPIFAGLASYRGVRPDVGALFGDRFTESGYGLLVEHLPPGSYDLAVFAWSTAQGQFAPARVVRVVVR